MNNRERAKEIVNAVFLYKPRRIWEEDLISKIEAALAVRDEELVAAARDVINAARCPYCDGSGLMGDYSMSIGTRPACECCGGHEDSPGCGYDLTPEAVEKLNALAALVEGVKG